MVSDSKASSPIVAVSGTVTREREEQRAKARLPMEVRPAGKVTRAREEQFQKALSMEVRLAGKAT